MKGFFVFNRQNAVDSIGMNQRVREHLVWQGEKRVPLSGVDRQSIFWKFEKYGAAHKDQGSLEFDREVRESRRFVRLLDVLFDRVGVKNTANPRLQRKEFLAV